MPLRPAFGLGEDWNALLSGLTLNL